jgi:hypothetical protein
MPDSSPAHYASLSEEFVRLTAGEFRSSVASEQEQRAAACGYAMAQPRAIHTGELVDFLSVSSPCVLPLLIIRYRGPVKLSGFNEPCPRGRRAARKKMAAMSAVGSTRDGSARR